jgi:hypothetical protein
LFPRHLIILLLQIEGRARAGIKPAEIRRRIPLFFRRSGKKIQREFKALR